MAIKETEVWVSCGYRTDEHYINKGYIIPFFIDSRNRKLVDRRKKILVKVEDLPERSNVKVTKICDICGDESSKKQGYEAIILCRKNSKDKLDKCRKCSSKKVGERRMKASIENCIATTYPEFAKSFWNKEDTFKYSPFSNQKADFKCLSCGRKIKDKAIHLIKRRGLSCICKDGFYYTEKFFYKFLEQLNIEFEYQKIFDWSIDIKTNNTKLDGTKIYDFYLNELNIIVETHGEQHSVKGFDTLGGRTLEEEQQNDELKESLAIKNKINNYIIIDCKFSEMEFIKLSILKSKLNQLFDLSQIDWLECHKFACSSLVVEICELWNELKSVKKISEKLNPKLSRTTIYKYLKIGNSLDLCDYNVQKIKRFNRTKAIIQLNLNGEYIREWESQRQVTRELGIKHISPVCNGKRETAGDFIWMFKEEYTPQKALERAKNRKKVGRKVGTKVSRKGKPIIQLTLKGEYICGWDSVTDVEKALGGGISKHISCVCKGKRKSAKGYKWMYAEDYYQQKEALIPLDLMKENQSYKPKAEQLELAFN